MTDPDRAAQPGAVGAIPPGADALRRLVAVMDRLRSPGGCPWDAEQTHASLVPYVLEEAHEVAEAIESGDRAHLREELGDLLLQVVFHARIAQEDPADPFGIDDIAEELVAKLVRRHPHVFADAPVAADAQAADADGVYRQWEQIKQAEKRRASALDGVPLALGALARAQKIAARARRAGLEVTAGLEATAALDSVDVGVGLDSRGTASGVDSGPGVADGLGERLLAVVLDAERAGVDAEGELRRAARAWEQRLRAAEAECGGPAA